MKRYKVCVSILIVDTKADVFNAVINFNAEYFVDCDNLKDIALLFSNLNEVLGPK